MTRIDLLIRIMVYTAASIGYLPLALHLHPFARYLFPVALVFAIIGDRRGFILNGWLTTVLAIGACALYFPQFGRQNFVDPAVNLLALFLIIRVVSEKIPRNIMQGFVLALFCLAASSLFELSPVFLLYLALLLLIFTTTMTLLTFRSRAADFEPSPPDLRRICTIAVLQPLLAAPLAIFFFFILPRTNFPLWQSLALGGAARGGISETITPGDRSSIDSGGATIFRAQMEKLPVAQPYWRMTVLSSIKGGTWTRVQPPTEKVRLSGGRAVRQDILLEPGQTPYLPTLNTPQSIEGYRGEPGADRVFPVSGLHRAKREYTVTSLIDPVYQSIGTPDRRFYTNLPDNIDPQLQSLVARAIAGKNSDEARMAAVEQLFISLKLSYATSNLPTGGGAINRFLFHEKRGHCELFATSFATALRLAGVPVRLVGGFLGGQYNDLGGYYSVSEERAHVWVEAWSEKSGWLTIDPSRYGQSFAESLTPKTRPFALRASLLLDNLSYQWNRLVITYDLESQMNTAVTIGSELRDVGKLTFPARKTVITCVAALLLAALVSSLKLRRRSREEQLLIKFRRKVKAEFGIEVKASDGVVEAAEKTGSNAAREFAAIWCGAVYRDRKLEKDEIERLESCLRKIVD